MVGIFMFEMQGLSFDSTKRSKDLLSNGRRRFQQKTIQRVRLLQWGKRQRKRRSRCKFQER